MIIAYVEGCLDKAVVEELLRSSKIEVDVRIAGGSLAPLEQALDESKGFGKCFLIAIDSDYKKREKLNTFEEMMVKKGIKKVYSGTSELVSYYVAKVNGKEVVFIVTFWEPELENVLWESLREVGCEEPEAPSCCKEKKRWKLYRKLECITLTLCLAREGTLVTNGNKCGFNVRRALRKVNIFKTKAFEVYVKEITNTLKNLCSSKVS